MAININKKKKDGPNKSIKELIADFLDGFASLPDPIKNKCFLNLLLSIGGFVGIFVAAIVLKTMMAVFPFIGMFIFGLVMIYSNVSNHIKGKILILEGDCYAIELTPIKNNTQKVYFKCNESNVCVRMKERYKKIQKGDRIIVYVLETTPMYEDHGIFIINNYIAAKITTALNETEEETPNKFQNIIKFNKK